MLNTAFVGVGWWGTVLAEAVAKFPNRIRISGATSVDTDDLRRFNERFGGVAYSDLDQILSDPNVQAVFIATPHSRHSDQVCAVATSGKHVFVEKPLALTTADARRAAQACQKAGVVLAVGHNRRLMPAALALKSMLAKKELGFVLHAEAHFSVDSAMRYQTDEWRAQRHEVPGGALTSLGIHMIDTLVWLFGPVTRVTCLSQRKVLHVDIDDTTCALLEFDCGLTGYLATLFATPLTSQLRLSGTLGSAVAEQDFTRLIKTTSEGEQHVIPLDDSDSVAAEIQAFANSCTKGKPYPVTLQQAVHNVAVVSAMLNSSEAEGAWTEVER